MNGPVNDSANRVIVAWLLVVCMTIFAMIVVGGVTRLTHSGLSMVEWEPIVGIIPPIGEQEWNETFEAYKQYPEYQKVNRGMSLDEFKSIFYWEYGHRVLGRVIGIVFFVPFALLWITGRIGKTLRPGLLFALVLGGLQGLMGWYMVKSGLVDMPRVSHYRLAAHLLLALAILSWLWWMILGLLGTTRERTPRYFRGLAHLTLALLVVQITWGAFTAGLRAGLGFNTFPRMNGEWLASAATMMVPFWHNFIENGAMVQFIHRWTGTLLLALAVVLFVEAFRTSLPVKARRVCGWFLLLCLAQYSLGVMTLVHYVPLLLASLHQALAVLLLGTGILMIHTLGPAAGKDDGTGQT